MGTSPSTRHLRIEPTQMSPAMEQKKSRPIRTKRSAGLGEVARAERLVGQAIARFDAEPFPGSMPTLFWRPIQVNPHNQHPFGATLASFGASSGSENTAPSDLRRNLLVLTFIE